ncbi:DUF3618 domain-containing protein [Nakamurella silvestris]|nr:DUF3618 domain-containing protein [Nakamurella silvestris]
MARDPETIQADIERARDALAITVDELSVRANPKRAVEQGKEMVQTKLAEPKIKYTLIGVGALVGFLILRKLFR